MHQHINACNSLRMSEAPYKNDKPKLCKRYVFIPIRFYQNSKKSLLMFTHVYRFRSMGALVGLSHIFLPDLVNKYLTTASNLSLAAPNKAKPDNNHYCFRDYSLRKTARDFHSLPWRWYEESKKANIKC